MCGRVGRARVGMPRCGGRLRAAAPARARGTNGGHCKGSEVDGTRGRQPGGVQATRRGAAAAAGVYRSTAGRGPWPRAWVVHSLAWRQFAACGWPNWSATFVGGECGMGQAPAHLVSRYPPQYSRSSTRSTMSTRDRREGVSGRQASAASARSPCSRASARALAMPPPSDTSSRRALQRALLLEPPADERQQAVAHHHVLHEAAAGRAVTRGRLSGGERRCSSHAPLTATHAFIHMSCPPWARPRASSPLPRTRPPAARR